MPVPKSDKPEQSKAKGVPASVSVSPGRDRVTLCKGVHRWTFSCEEGEERNLLMRLAELAQREDVPFDWFDAALVSHQLRNRLLPGLQRTESPGSPAGALTKARSPKTG
ncbi:MAG TPA: hypothetical protein VHC70_07085 [Phycisphaerales bacterium]|jgi:hypothetical protein|nr:hypothetical protein [Phycisphaerales bacterium]